MSKHFRIQEGNTIKEFLPAFLKGRGWTPPFHALSDLSFAVNQGEVLGIIGRNGSGKSTMLKLIARVMTPSLGHVMVAGHVCPLIELGPGFHPDLSGRENLHLNASLLGLSNREIRERYAEIVAFGELEDFMETPLKHYSSGMHVRLGFAVAIHCRPEILIIDEALAVGDAHFQAKCLARMAEIRGSGVTIIFASHDLQLITSFCDRVLLLDQGRLLADGEPGRITSLYRQLIANE